MINFFTKFKARTERALSIVMAHLIFLVGIGSTSLLAKLVGKDFLVISYHHTSWLPYQTSNKLEKMY